MNSTYDQSYQYQPPVTRSACPQISSPTSIHSTYQSSTCVSSLTSMSTSPSQTNMHSRQSPVLSSAPLPSPTGERQPAGGHYFGSIQPDSTQSQVQPFQIHESQLQSSFQQASQHHQSPTRRGSEVGGGQETAPYLQGFNLLAEAAKRAEMAVMMRDLGELEM